MCRIIIILMITFNIVFIPFGYLSYKMKNEYDEINTKETTALNDVI